MHLSRHSFRELLLAGLFAIATGVFVVLLVSGIIPSKGALYAPLWVAVCAGLVFVLAGAALVLRAAAGGSTHDGALPDDAPFWMRVAQYILGLTVIGALATIGSWVAFGPGERAFAMTIPFLGSGPGDQWAGRALFGAGAVMVWVFFIMAAVSWGRKLRRRA